MTAFKRWARKTLDRTRFTSAVRRYVKGLRGAHWAYFHGNYGSPVPDRDEVEAYFGRTGARDVVPGVRLRGDEQFALLQQFKSLHEELPFPTAPKPPFRYHLGSTCFGYSDAVFLYCVLRHFRPRRVVEIGSGWSSTVILDTLAHSGRGDVDLTFVDPWPDNLERLRARMTPAELAKATVVGRKVQDVDASVFAALQSGDLLFIASSHIVKCGSDVQRLFFEILPALPAGVVVHFHGVNFPFEYPASSIAEGRYFNESYFLRAFLSYNDSWEIVLFNDYVNREFEAFLREHMPRCLEKPGSSIYLRRIQ